MNGPQQVLNESCRFTARLALITILTSVSASVIAGPTLPGPKWQTAEETENEEVAYVDSVKSWGAWELDIEPAAGGLTPPSTQAMNPRNSKVSLRTNSIAALAPPAPPAPAPPIIPNTPVPITPIVTPQIPTVTDISPNIPIPVGAP